ncbi:MAG: hypothetical protein L6R36_008153, partial [Xanthoria steineri]
KPWQWGITPRYWKQIREKATDSGQIHWLGFAIGRRFQGNQNWREVSREVIQELGTKDFKQIFDQSVKVARAAAESAKQFRKSMKLEVHDMQSKLIAKELKVQEVNSELDNVKQKLTIERAQLQDTRTAVEDERGNVAKKNERIAILTAQLQGARTSAKDERATVAKQDRKIATLPPN